jgi:hypothetical protein
MTDFRESIYGSAMRNQNTLPLLDDERGNVQVINNWCLRLSY